MLKINKMLKISKKNRNKKSMSLHILCYFIMFSIVLLSFLWIFQILCLNTYYKVSRKKVLESTLNSLVKSYGTEDYKQTYDDLSANNDICVEIVANNLIEYSSSAVDKKCMNRNNIGLLKFQTDFIKSGDITSRAEIINPNYNNKTLVIGKKLDDDTYLFVNTSLVPLGEGIKILKSQFIFIAIVMFIMSSIVSYFISKRLSIPIININNKAKQIGKKDYSVVFDDDTEVLH